jgi:CheY-like chemotaxis protein
MKRCFGAWDVMENSHPRRKVLIVEDDGVCRQILNHLLDKHGYEPFMVGTGGQALRFVHGRAVDLILMDVMLPDIDGLSVTAAIRESEQQHQRSRVPIVAVTALALDERDWVTAGTDGYLQKPFLPEQLLAMVQKLVRAHD